MAITRRLARPWLWAMSMALLISAVVAPHSSAWAASSTATRPAARPNPLAATASPLRPGALASSSLHLVGLRLTAPTERIDIPKDAPFSMPLGVWLGDHRATADEIAALVPADSTLTGILTGPGIASPQTVSGKLATGLDMPGLTAEGDYALSDIRLVKGGTTVLEADPKTVNIRCLGEILISSVTSTPMTMQELRDAGVQLQPGDYIGQRFTMGLVVGSQAVNLTVPVAVPIYNGLEDPRGGSEFGRLEITGEMKHGFPDLSVVAANITPETDPFSLSRPSISHTLRHSFKAFIVIPGSIGYLRQFYKVNLVVFNALQKDSPFKITHLSTTLNLPLGGDGAAGTADDPLGLAAREGETDAATKPVRGPDTNGAMGLGDPVVKGGESGMATFFVKALKEGAHPLNFDVRGQFEGGGLSQPVALSGRAQGKVLVRNPDFSLVLVHPEVVRRGEEYTLEARLTNTSDALANAVTVTLDKARLGSVKLVEDLNKPVDTLRPGETVIFKYKLRALRNGEVRSSYLYMEQGTIGFQLTTGLGERNIRLNPDTLLLPQTLEGRKGLPEPLREAMLRVLGQAYSVASTKGGLPAGVLPIPRSLVTGQLSEELSEQGLFLRMGMDKARVWMRLWEMFIQNANPGFDQLVRTTDAGRELRNAFIEAWEWADPNHPMGERLGDMLGWNGNPGASAAAVIEGAGSGLGLEMQDAAGNRILSGDIATKALPSLPQPHAAWGGHGSRQWISLPTPLPAARLRLVNHGSEAQALKLDAIAPVAGASPTYNHFEFQLDPGHSALITFGGAPEASTVHFAADGNALGVFRPSQTQDLMAEPFQVLAVHRYDVELDPTATPYGTHVMMLFNRPIMTLNLPSGKEGQDAAKALVEVEANAPWLKAMAPNPETGEVPSAPPALFKAYPRVASLYLERPVGPYVPRQLSLSSAWTDAKGNALMGALSWPILCGDIPGGALVRGKVRKVSGEGLSAKMTYWYFAQSKAGNLDLASGKEFLAQEIDTHYALVSNFSTEADGSYQLDYVPEPVSFALGPMLLQGATAEGTAWGQASVLGNGQLIEMDLVLEGKGSVDGYVLDGSGTPVPEAQVQVIQEQPSNPLTRGTGGGTFVQSTKTDANGHYRVDNLKTGVFSIRVLKGLFGAATSNAISRDGETVYQNVVLEAPTGTIKARLLDLSGQVVLTEPIGLGIASGLLRDQGAAAKLVWPERATPGADGWVTFSGVPAGDVGLMVPGLPYGTVTDWFGYLESGSTQEVTLKMLPTGEQAYANFLVVDSAGKPVQGVYLFDQLGDPRLAFAITDEEGRAPKRPILSGRSYQVLAYHPGWTGKTPSESVVLQPGENRLVRTVMPPRGALHGTVKHPDGTPVKGAYVAIPPVYDDMKKNRLAITNAKGEFILPNVPVGSPFRLAAVGPELRTAMEPMNIQVADGQDLPLNLILPLVGKNQVSGTVYQPMEGAQKIPTMAQIWVDGLLPDITPVYWGNWHWGLLRREATGFLSTGPTGAYVFKNLPQGAFTLHANSDIFPVEVKSGGDFADKVEDQQTRDVYLSSSFAGELKGTIYQRDGQTPVAPDVRVRLIGGSIGELIIFTTEGGRYRFPKVIPEGCYKLRVEDPVSGDISVVGVEMKKEFSQIRNLRLWGRGTLTVRVQDSFGRILPEGVVTLSHSKSANLECPPPPTLDKDDLPPLAQKLKPEMEGLLIFEDLLEGPVSLELKNPTGLMGVASVSMPEGGGNAEVVVRLQPVGDVLGTLYRADGTLVPAGRVDAYQGDRWLGVSPTRMDGVSGRFRFQVLPTGPIRIEAWDPDSRQMGKGTVNVVAGETSEITLTTHDKGPVVITVAQEGRPAASAAVRLSYRGGDALDFSTESTTDADGKAIFHLPPGDYTATATDRVSLAMGTVSFSRAVDQGEIQTAITLQAVRSLWATAVPPPGALAGFSLEGWSLKDRAMGRSILLDARGQGMLRDLPVGNRTLILTDLRGRHRGNFTATLTAEGGAVQTPASSFQALAYGNVDVTVVDAHGQPAPGVSVSAGGGGGSIRTDGAGLARFLGLQAGNLHLSAGGASGSVLLRNEGETVSATLQVPPTASVHGSVFDALGQPVPFVLVSVGFQQTATDGQGTFRVSGLGLGTYTVTALTPQGRRAAVKVTLSQADQDAEVRLDFPPQGSLTGTVKDPLRASPPPVHVMVYLAAGGNQVGDIHTDPQGAFRFPSIPAGQDLRVEGVLEDGRTKVFNRTFSLAPQEGSTLNLDLTLPALVDVKGWTLDPMGNKIPMTVLLQDDRGNTLDRAVTTGDIFDPDHPTFFFRYLLAGQRYRLLGLQEMSTTAIAYLDHTPVGDKELEEIILQAQTRRDVRLQARYPDGSPTPGPGRFSITSQSLLGGRWDGDLGTDGSALIKNLPEGPATATLWGLPNQPTLSATFVVPAQGTVHDVTVPALGLGSLTVKVQTTSGRLLSGGTLTAQASGSPRWIGQAQGDGTFRLDGLWIGLPLSLQATGFGLVGSAPAVTLNQHGQHQALTFPAPDQGSLSGIIRDSRGTPVAGAIVLVRTTGRSTTTDASGAYRFAELPLGTHSLLVTVPNRVERAVASTTLGSDGQTLALDVALKGVGTVRVRVVNPEGIPVSGQMVSVSNISAHTDGRSLSATTDAQGVTSFSGVLEGEIRASALIGSVNRSVEGSLAEGGTLSLDLQTKDLSRIAGRLRRASTAPWPAGSMLKIQGLSIPLLADGTLAETPQVDYVASSVAVQASIGGLRDLHVGYLQLVKNGTTTLDLTAPAFGAMTGQVKDVRGALVPGAVVSASGASTSTDAQGVFRLDGLSVGTHQLLATLPNRVERSLAEGAIAVDGETRAYIITLKGTGTVRVTALAADGSPLAGQTVRLQNHSDWADRAAILSGQTDAQGVATFTGVLEGSLSASATLLDRTYYQSGTLNLDGTLNLTLKVRDFTTLSGRISRAKEGNLWPVGSRATLADRTYDLNPDGTLVTPTPNPQVDFGSGSTYVYVNVPNGIQLSVGTLTLVKNGETVVDLTAPGFGSLYGTVKLPDGNPAVNISVRVDDWTYLTTDASGAWRLPMTTTGPHRVVARTSTSVASGDVTLAEDGGTAGLDLILTPNTVSLPVSMNLGRLDRSATIDADGNLTPPGGRSSRIFLAVDGAAEMAAVPPNGIAQWIERDRQLSYTLQVGPLEVTVTRTVAPDAVSLREEIRFRNTDVAAHRVVLRNTVSTYGYAFKGLPSGASQPLLTGPTRDAGIISDIGTLLWGNGPLAPLAADGSGIQWPELALAPGEVKTLALAHAPYQLPDGWSNQPSFDQEGAVRLLDRAIHGAPEWVYGSNPSSWANWLPPQEPKAEALAPWDATLNLTLKDAFGSLVKNQVSGTFFPKESLAPNAGLSTGSPLTRQPRDGGRVSLTLPGASSLSFTRDLLTTGAIDVVASEGSSISARVRDSHGNPVASVSVDFPYIGSTSTDASGDTGLWLLAPGTYDIQATLPNSGSTVKATARLNLGAGQTQVVDLTFPAVGGLQVSLLGPNGLPYASWAYGYLKPISGSEREAYISNGIFTWANVLPGTYTLRIPDPRTGGTLPTSSVTISADNVTQATVRLPGLGQAQVVVLDPLGNRVPRNQYVSITGADGGSRGAYTDDSGTATITNLAPGLATVTVTNNANYFSASVPITITDGQMATATIQLPGSGSLQITLTTADGRPVVSRYFDVLKAGGTSSVRSGYTDASGRMTLNTLQTLTDLVLVDGQGNSTDPFNPKVPPISFRLTQHGEVLSKVLTLPLGSLKVLVREPGTGSPVPGARVWFRSFWHAYAYADANGFAILNDAPLDTAFPVGASLGGYRDAQNDAVVVSSSQPAGTLTLDLPKIPQIGFKLLRANGTAPLTFNWWDYRNWYFRLTSSSPVFNEQRTSTSPNLTWTNLLPGEYTAEAFALVGTGKDGSLLTSSGATWPWKAQAQVSLSATNPQPLLTLRLPALAAWTLHLKGEDGLPLALDRTFRLSLKSSTVPGYLLQDVAFNSVQIGADLVMAEHFPEGTHTFSVLDEALGELKTLDLVIKPEQDAQRIEQDLVVPTPALTGLILHLRDPQGNPLQQDHGFRLTVKTSTKAGFELNAPLSGTDPATGLQFPEGTHTLAVVDSSFGEVHSFELTVAPSDKGRTLERTLNLPYVHATWTTTPVASDGATPALGAYLRLFGTDSSFWMNLDPGTSVSLEVPSDRSFTSWASFEPLGQGMGLKKAQETAPARDMAANVTRVQQYGEPRTLAEGQVVNEILQLPLTVARFRLLDQDGQTPMADQAAHLILPDEDAQNFPMLPWTDAQGVSRLLLLGQPEASAQDVILFDPLSGMGKAVQVRIPALGQTLDMDQQIPAYAWLHVGYKDANGNPATYFEVGVGSTAPGIVAPWAARWTKYGSGGGVAGTAGGSAGSVAPKPLSLPQTPNEDQLGPIRVPAGLETLWGQSYGDMAAVQAEAAPGFSNYAPPQRLVLTDLLSNETRTVEFLATQTWKNFSLKFQDAAGVPLDPALFEGGSGSYTLSLNGALPYDWWWDEEHSFYGPNGRSHRMIADVPFTIQARLPRYNGQEMVGTVTDVVTETTNGKVVTLTFGPPPPTLPGLILHLRDSRGQPLQQDHGFWLTVKSSNRPNFYLDLPLSGTDPVLDVQFPKGTHTLAIEDSSFGEVHAFELTVTSADMGQTLGRTLNLPYIHATWTTTVLAGDGQTPALGAYLEVYAPDSWFWMTLEPGTPVSLEVPSNRSFESYVSFVPLSSSLATPVSVEQSGEARTLVEGQVVNDTLQLPLTVARFRLLDQDGQTPMAEQAAHLVLPNEDARDFPMLPWIDAQGITRFLLLGQPEASTQDVILFDPLSGMGKAVQVQIPALGQALDMDQQIPAYAWLQVGYKDAGGTPATAFEVGVGSTTPGIVAPWAARWIKQGSGGSGVKAAASVQQADGENQLGPIRVPAGLETLWGQSDSGVGVVSGGVAPGFSNQMPPQRLILSGLLPNETRTVEFLANQTWKNFSLKFQDSAGLPLDPALFGGGSGYYTLSLNGALPYAWWWDENARFSGPDGGSHRVVADVPFTIRAGLLNYNGQDLVGTVTDVITEATDGKDVPLTMNPGIPPPPPNETKKSPVGDLSAKDTAASTKDQSTETLHTIPLVNSTRKLLLHLKKHRATPPPRSRPLNPKLKSKSQAKPQSQP